MSGGRYQRAKGKKNKVKERLEKVEKVQSQGIDLLIREVQRLDGNDRVIAEGFEDIDLNAATLRSLLVQKGIITDEEFGAEKARLVALKLQAQKQAEQKRKEEEATAEAERMLESDDELVRMKNAAESAGQEGHPEEAFIFGG